MFGMSPSSKKTILVIDDDLGIRTAMAYMLEDAGYSVITSEDSAILDNLKEESVHLIIIDLLLSGKNGSNIVKKLKNQTSTNKIPIIMLSAHPSAEQQSKDSGADGFLAKPFNIEDLLKIIKTHIK